MISHKYKCIFIHIPKTAGTSIEKKLGLFVKAKPGVQDHRTIREIEPFSLAHLGRLCQQENLYLSLKRIYNLLKGRRTVSREMYNAYFKFTFVRNPWSRVFSWYGDIMRNDVQRRRFGVPDNCLFKDFLNNHINKWFLRSQLFWIMNIKGENPMDFIGRFERLEKDFFHVCDVLGIEDKSLPIIHQLIVGVGQHYTQFYDDEMKENVAQKYKDEIALFKFEFGE